MPTGGRTSRSWKSSIFSELLFSVRRSFRSADRRKSRRRRGRCDDPQPSDHDVRLPAEPRPLRGARMRRGREPKRSKSNGGRPFGPEGRALGERVPGPSTDGCRGRARAEAGERRGSLESRPSQRRPFACLTQAYDDDWDMTPGSRGRRSNIVSNVLGSFDRSDRTTWIPSSRSRVENSLVHH